MTAINKEEISRFRAGTSGTAERIHFNNAGSSLPPDIVVDTMISYLKEEARLGGYETADKYAAELNGVYPLIAQLINADNDEVAIAENASIAWGMAFNGIRFEKGDQIITSEYEYVTNVLGFLRAKKEYNISVHVIPNDEQGRFSLDALQAAITPRTRLISVTHIASTTGGVLPVAAIGAIARKNNILYLLDACQSVGHIPVDVKAIQCDMLSVTGRKYMRAPRGTGLLYVRKEIQDQLRVSFMDGFTVDSVSEEDYQLRSDARRFELYEKNKALMLGLGKAVEYALAIGMDRIWQRIQHLADLLRRQLSEIDGITIHDQGDQLCGIVTFSIRGVESTTVKNALAEKNINVNVGIAKSTLYFMNKHDLTSLVRASVHYFNTEEEVTIVCNAIKNMIIN